MTNQQSLIPPVIWAQRNNVVFVTICVEDSINPTVKIEPEQIVFHSVAGLTKKVYEITIPLFGAVEPENSKTTIGGRCIELVLQKPLCDVKYWPHLTKEKKKYHWLKVDFKKWKDEDDSDDEAASGGAPGGGLGGDNFDDMLSMMGGGGAGESKFGGLGGGLGGDYNEPSDEDSDDEEMPDLDDIESETTGKAKEKKEGDIPDLEEPKPTTA